MWDKYFKLLVDIEYKSYSIIHKYPEVRELFEKTSKNHFSSLEIKEKLYNKSNLDKSKFGGILYDVLEPEYKAALNSGFKLWQ